MADKKVSDLTAITGANTASDDVFLIVDTSEGVTKKITRAELNNAIEVDAFASVDINDGTIDNTVIGGTTPEAGTFTTLTTTGAATIAGDLTVNGTTTTINSTTLDVDDLNITVASGAADAAAANGAGLTVDGASATLTYASATDRWETNKSLKVDGSFIADGVSIAESSFTFDPNGTTLIQGFGASTVRLFHSGNQKLETTSTGVDVTGTITSDDLLVVKTSSDTNTVGVEARSNGQLVATLDGGTALIANRKTSDGDVVKIMKDGSTVGVIGTQNWGVGTSSPDRLLHLASSAAIVCIEDTAGATDDKRAQIQVDNGQFEINSRNDDNSSRTDNIFVADLGTGNIGLGTNSADTNLEISDTSGAVLRLSGHTGGAINVTPYDIGSIEFKSDDASGEGPRVVATVKTEADTASTVPGGELVFETREAGNGASLDERMRITSDGSVGIGTDTPDTLLELRGADPILTIRDTNTSSASSNATLRLAETGASDALDAYWDIKAVGGNLQFIDNWNEGGGTGTRVVIDDAGRVVIGTDSGDAFNSDASLRLQAGGNNYVQIKTPSTNQAGFLMGDTDDDFAGGMIYNNSGNYLRFDSDNGERLRITGADFMFNATTSNPLAVIQATGGDAIGIKSTSGYVAIKRNEAGAALYINKTDSIGGQLIQFRRNGSDNANIGFRGTGTVVHIGAGDTGLEFHSADNRVYPTNPSTAVLRDNAIDLGGPSYRFDDVYATNGTIQTSDQNEKQQIASLTDAEITAAKAISKLFKTFKWNDSVEEKGDAARTHAGVIAQDVQQAMSNAGLDAGDYAFFISTTWWEAEIEVPAVEAVEAVDAVYEDVVIEAVLDDDGNEIEPERTEQRLVSEAVEPVEAQDAYTRTENYNTAEEAPEGATERTRMGIRYPELLAFIGAATEQRLADIETRLTALEN
jgi:hypothetical protein